MKTLSVRGSKTHSFPFKKSRITYPQLWLVEIHAAHKQQLSHKALGQTPGPVDGHCQSVCDVSMDPTEGRREVSAE